MAINANSMAPRHLFFFPVSCCCSIWWVECACHLVQVWFAGFARFSKPSTFYTMHNVRWKYNYFNIALFLSCFFFSFTFFQNRFACIQFSLTMDADVLSALRTQAAFLAGSDRPIIIVKAPAGELKSTWKKQPLELCLQYLISSLR